MRIQLPIGAVYNDGNGTDAGHTRIYEWNGSAWVQKGTDINGEAAGDYSGRAVSMPDPNTVAIGAHLNDGSASAAGHVRIFQWNGSTWVQKGLDIDGEAANSYSGVSACMPDANTVAIGAIGTSGTGNTSGHVRIFNWNGTAWIQDGSTIHGEGPYNSFGYSVNMPDNSTLGVGAIYNGQTGTNAGSVRVFSTASVDVFENGLEDGVLVAPNPTNGMYSIALNETYSNVTVITRNTLGQEISNQNFISVRNLELEINGAPGIYFVEVLTGDKRAVLRVIKE
ncbi:MAG: T9SS type A sorting domain-containing protein [Bacteroidetes bacterium]|nr:T9SS type A sorting domain-containing protein [Bacteroidota bacterium]